MSRGGPGLATGIVVQQYHDFQRHILAAVRRLWSYFAPLRDRVEPLQVVANLCLRSRRELVVENATLRPQLSVLRRTSGVQVWD